MSTNKIKSCPCGSTSEYLQCCGQYIEQGITAPSAETLMRSRYTAYAMHDVAYLLRSWHESTRPLQLDLDEGVKWNKLDILATTQGTPVDDQGSVEFIAHYQFQNQSHKIREVSQFIKQNHCWFYVDGVMNLS